MGEIEGMEPEGAIVGSIVGLVVRGVGVGLNVGEVKLGDLDGDVVGALVNGA